jgi:hypothetical protein
MDFVMVLCMSTNETYISAILCNVLVCVFYMVAFYKCSVENECPCVREKYCQGGVRVVVKFHVL